MHQVGRPFATDWRALESLMGEWCEQNLRAKQNPGRGERAEARPIEGSTS